MKNLTADGVTNNIIIPKRTKSMGVRFHWILFWYSQKLFHCYWDPRIFNLPH